MSDSSREIRLVIVTHFYPSHGGGIEKVAETLANGLADRGFLICWFSSDTDPVPYAAKKRIESVAVSTSNLVERLTQLPYPLWSPRALPRMWREIRGADVVHVHEHLYLPSIIAIILARLHGRPVVITQHMGALGLGSRTFRLLYSAGARLLGLLLFPVAARTVFISQNVLRFFGREESPRTRLIFNGADVQRFAPVSGEQRAAIRNQLGLPGDRRVILFVGRFVRKKGVHRIVALSRRLPEVLWIFVGSGPEGPDTRLSNVRVAGQIAHEQLPRYYQAADLLILPSTGEGLPLVVQEALCCGAGVLSTDEVATACPEAADMIRAQPVPQEKDTIAGWETALRSILADSLYLGETSRAERGRRARKLWSWDHCISQYEEIFRELAGNR